MPLSRQARQARQMQGARSQHPSNRKARGTWTPRIDVYGTLRIADAEFRCRLIEYAPQHFAAFTTDVANPVTFQTDGDFNIKGRIMTANLQNEGSEVKFQKAGCGCETPQELRISRGKLLENLPITSAELELEVPDTVPEFPPERFT